MENPFARTVRQRTGIPVLPGGLPVIGHLFQLYDNPIKFVRAARAEVGRLFWAKFTPRRWALVVTGEAVLDLLKDRSLLTDGYQEDLPEIFGSSMITRSGTAHAHLRSAMNPPFTPRGLAENRSVSTVAELVTERVDRWAGRRHVDVLAETQGLTLDVIFRLIGIERNAMSEWARQFRELLLSSLQIPILLPGFPLYRARRARVWLDRHLLEIVEATRRRAGPPEGLLGNVVHARDDSGDPLSDEEIVDNLRLLGFAGHDTTATTMAWLVVTLARRPDLWEALREEAGRGGELPRTPQDMQRFPFAEALLRETLRVYPPTALVSRTTSEPLSIYGHTIPPGTPLLPFLCDRLYDPEIFPEPDRFDPSRWLGRSAPLGAAEIVSFGGGHHFCLGYHLALTEGALLAIALGKRGLRPRLTEDRDFKYLLFRHPSPRPRVRLTA